MDEEKETYAVHFSSDSKYLATADAENGRIWEVKRSARQCLETQDRIRDRSVSIFTSGWSAAFGADNQTIVTAAENGGIALWNINQRQVKKQFILGSAVTAVGYNSVHNLIAGAGLNGTVKVWNNETGKTLGTLVRNKVQESLAFDHGGDFLARGGADSILSLWHFPTQKLFNTKLKESIHLVAFVAQDTRVLAIDAAGGVWLWDIDSKKILKHIKFIMLTAVAVSSDQRIMAFAEKSGISLLDTRSGNQIIMISFQDPGWSIAISPGNNELAVGGFKKDIVQIIGINTKKILHQFVHSSNVYGITYSHDGQYIATGCSDSTLHVWDIRADRETVNIHWNAGDPVERVQFSFDDKYLFGASSQYKTSGWLWRSQDALQYLCSCNGKSLSREEWNFYLSTSEPYNPACYTH